MIQLLPGTWHLHHSTFPMWQKEGVHSVTFHYSLTTLDDQPALLDQVKYFKNDRLKTLTGYDRPDPSDPSAFIWRGKGLLWFFQSHWRVEWLSEDGSAIIISFAKTIATPAGVDILTRGTGDTTALVAQAQQVISDRQLLKDVSAPLLEVK